MPNIPDIYCVLVDDVITNCSELFSKRKLDDKVLIQLKDLWLSKLEAKGDEYIDLNYINTSENQHVSVSKKNQSNPKKSEQTAIQKRFTTLKRKPSRIKREKQRAPVSKKNQTNPKKSEKPALQNGMSTLKCLPAAVLDMPLLCTVTAKNTQDNPKNLENQVSGITVINKNKIISKQEPNVWLKKIDKKENKFKQRKANLQKVLNRAAKANKTSSSDQLFTTQKYNYIYKNNNYSYKNRQGNTHVKIILPRRTGYSIKERTCMVKAPCWFLSGTQLPNLLCPLIKEISQLPLSEATAALQECINNYELFQLDGNGVKIQLKSQGKNVMIRKNCIRDLSDLDSDDDVSDCEDADTAFYSENQIMCLFSIVKRKKFEWSLKLQNGIMEINNKVYMFKTADGLVEW